MKGKRHIQSFNEHQENLNISDVISSFEGMRLLKKDEIKKGKKVYIKGDVKAL